MIYYRPIIYVNLHIYNHSNSINNRTGWPWRTALVINRNTEPQCPVSLSCCSSRSLVILFQSINYFSVLTLKWKLPKTVLAFNTVSRVVNLIRTSVIYTGKMIHKLSSYEEATNTFVGTRTSVQCTVVVTAAIQLALCLRQAVSVAIVLDTEQAYTPW